MWEENSVQGVLSEDQRQQGIVKQGHSRNLKSLTPAAIANIKHSLPPSHIKKKKTNFTLKSYASHFPKLNTHTNFNKKLQGIWKDRKKKSEETKQILKPESDMTQI